MYPLLFEIPIFGGLKIYTYGVLYALGVLAAIFLTVREAKRVGVRPDFILDLSFYLILGNLVGARILYIITDLKKYLASPMDVLKIWEGGLVFYGGLIGATLVAFYYIRKHKHDFLKIADLYMPGLALGHGIGRLGCFASGCCYGREMPDFPFAMTFRNDPHSLAPAGIPLFPSQSAEAATLFLIASALFVLLRRKRLASSASRSERRAAGSGFDGQVLLVYVILYSIARGILEIFRGDSIRGFVVQDRFSTSQFIGVCLVIFSVLLYIHLYRKNRRVS